MDGQFSLFFLLIAANGCTHAVPPCVGLAGWAWAAWSLSALLGDLFTIHLESLNTNSDFWKVRRLIRRKDAIPFSSPTCDFCYLEKGMVLFL